MCVRLARELDELGQRRAALQTEVVEKRKFLDGIPDQLRVVEESTRGLQRYLKIDMSDAVDRIAASSRLPAPLHLLYQQLRAYAESTGLSIEVEVVDSVSPKGNSGSRSDEGVSGGGVARSGGRKRDRDEDDDAGAGRGTPVGERPAKSARVEPSPGTWEGVAAWCAGHASGARDGSGAPLPAPNSVADLFVPADAAVVARLPASLIGRVGGEPAVLRFQYLPHLRIVTAEVEGQQHALANLFPDDTGERTPRVENHHHPLVQGGTAGLVFPEEVSGRPYRWAQWLAGLYTLPTTASALTEAAPRRIEPSTRSVVEAVCTRLAVMPTVKQQLLVLAATPNPIPVHESAASLFKAGRGADFVRWEKFEVAEGSFPFNKNGTATTAAAAALGATDGAAGAGAGAGDSGGSGGTSGGAEGDNDAVDVEEAGDGVLVAFPVGLSKHVAHPSGSAASAAAVDPKAGAACVGDWRTFQCQYFRAVFRSADKREYLQVLVELSPEYPVRAPRLRLDRVTGASHVIAGMPSDVPAPPSSFDADITAIEADVNGHVRELIPAAEAQPHLLTHQLRRVQDLFDHVSSGRRKAVPAAASGGGRRRRGRDRRPALVYDAVTNGFVHR